MALSLSDFTEDFVEARRDALKDGMGDRNDRMDDMVDLYRLDVWEKSAEPEERRVASPRAFTIVEAYRTLLFTRRPVISVTESQVNRVAQSQAEQIEKFLYGAWDEMRLLNVIDEVEFWACCAGRGVFKVVYQPRTPEDELPLMAQSIDPRCFFSSPSTFRPGESVEVAHNFMRTRREIEQDWGPLTKDRPDDPKEVEDWLDGEVEYTDYWRQVLVEEDKEDEDEIAEPGPVEQALTALQKLFGVRGEEEEEEEEPEKVWVRKVVNCVLADDEFVKDPVFVPGYERIPFFYWDGVHTPMPAEDESLSVLFPVSGGKRPSGTQGLLATENQLLSLKVRLLEIYANAAAVTNDPALSDLDMTPGAVTVASMPDYKIDWVMPPGAHPDADKVMMQVERLAQDSTIPASLQGRYEGEISGVALSLMTNPVLMRIAARQRDREEVLQQMNKLILGLVEEWAPAEGWVVFGKDRRDMEFECRLRPADIHGYRRNSVKLSASLPKDAQGELMLHANLVKAKMESRRTAIDRIQEVTGRAGHSPQDEIQQILIESILIDEEESRKAMALKALDEYDPTLAADVLGMQQGAQGMPGQQPGPPPQGPPMMGPGPMGGIPPQTVPPEMLGMGGAGPVTPPEEPPGL